MTDPELTVIVPTYERPELLKETIESILAAADVARRELGAGVRVLVVDDASPTDSTRELVATYKDRGAEYVRVPFHDGRKDPGAAIKLGVESTTTPYLTVFGDDDVMLPDHIAIHLRDMRHGYDVSAASFQVTDANLNVTRTVKLGRARLGDYLTGRIEVNDGSFVRTELIQAIELDPALLAQMLYPVWATLLIDGRRFTRSTKPTFLYRRHEANISSVNQDAADKATRQALQEKYRALAAEKLGAVPPPSHIDWVKHKDEWQRSKKDYLRWQLATAELAVKRNPLVRKAFRLPPLPPK